MPPDVLHHALAEIAVQRVDAAREAASVEFRIERDDPVRGRLQSGATSFRRRANARFNAAFGAGGVASARAKRS